MKRSKQLSCKPSEKKEIPACRTSVSCRAPPRGKIGNRLRPPPMASALQKFFDVSRHTTKYKCGQWTRCHTLPILETYRFILCTHTNVEPGKRFEMMLESLESPNSVLIQLRAVLGERRTTACRKDHIGMSTSLLWTSLNCTANDPPLSLPEISIRHQHDLILQCSLCCIVIVIWKSVVHEPSHLSF